MAGGIFDRGYLPCIQRLYELIEWAVALFPAGGRSVFGYAGYVWDADRYGDGVDRRRHIGIAAVVTLA